MTKGMPISREREVDWGGRKSGCYVWGEVEVVVEVVVVEETMWN